MIKIILTLCALVAFSNAFTKKEAMQYLFDFEHITALEDGQFVSGLKDFQKYAAIPITGILDQETKRMMQVARCFNPNSDRDGPEDSNRWKRYVTHGTKWHQRTLNYHMAYPQNVSKKLINRALRRSFDMWASHTGLRFNPSSKMVAHLNMRFDHTKRNVLGFASYPGGGGGKIVFSNRFQWTENSEQNHNFYQVALHEIGHALGLRHSNIRVSVMWPFYAGYVSDYKLHQDDIAGIKSLYN